VKIWTLSIIVTLGILMSSSLSTITSGVPSITSVSMPSAAHNASLPFKVLVIDWMSDPLLSRINTLVNESFNDGRLLRWTVGDLDLASGLDYWGAIDYRSHEGNGSVWCATNGREGIIGLSPALDVIHLLSKIIYIALRSVINCDLYWNSNFFLG
jgi:hypothetical protein